MKPWMIAALSLAAGGLWWATRASGPRLTSGAGGSVRIQPSNPFSGVTDQFGVGFDVSPTIFGGAPAPGGVGAGDGFGVAWDPPSWWDPNLSGPDEPGGTETVEYESPTFGVG